VQECWIGDNLLSFDGRIVELFGHPASPSARFHVENLDLDLADPDRRGDRTLTLRAATKRSGGVAVVIPAADLEAAEPVLAAVFEAIPGDPP
jgi:hypothetical protein